MTKVQVHHPERSSSATRSRWRICAQVGFSLTDDVPVPTDRPGGAPVPMFSLMVRNEDQGSAMRSGSGGGCGGCGPMFALVLPGVARSTQAGSVRGFGPIFSVISAPEGLGVATGLGGEVVARFTLISPCGGSGSPAPTRVRGVTGTSGSTVAAGSAGRASVCPGPTDSSATGPRGSYPAETLNRSISPSGTPSLMRPRSSRSIVSGKGRFRPPLQRRETCPRSRPLATASRFWLIPFISRIIFSVLLNTGVVSFFPMYFDSNSREVNDQHGTSRFPLQLLNLNRPTASLNPGFPRLPNCHSLLQILLFSIGISRRDEMVLRNPPAGVSRDKSGLQLSAHSLPRLDAELAGGAFGRTHPEFRYTLNLTNAGTAWPLHDHSLVRWPVTLDEDGPSSSIPGPGSTETCGPLPVFAITVANLAADSCPRTPCRGRYCPRELPNTDETSTKHKKTRKNELKRDKTL